MINKEQLEALIDDGRLEEACVMFANSHSIPASDLAGFVALILKYQSL